MTTLGIFGSGTKPTSLVPQVYTANCGADRNSPPARTKPSALEQSMTGSYSCKKIGSLALPKEFDIFLVHLKSYKKLVGVSSELILSFNIPQFASWLASEHFAKLH
jgi:hypothetical protein